MLGPSRSAIITAEASAGTITAGRSITRTSTTFASSAARASQRPPALPSLGGAASIRIGRPPARPQATALACGSTDPADLGPIPPGWLVRRVLPQVTLLHQSVAAVTHGGNNSVTEALTAGVPMLVLPLSTDQFAGAAALEQASYGEVLDPNAASAQEIREALRRLLSRGPDETARIQATGRALRSFPGAARARAALS